MARSLAMGDVAILGGMSGADCSGLANEILRVLREIPCIDDQERRDGAGVAIRGGSVFMEALEVGVWLAIEVAAARRYLMEHDAQRVLIDQIEIMPVL